MKYFFVTGEPSGDLHASLIIRALRDMDQNAEIKGTGGRKMQEMGVDIVLSIDKMAFMGWVEVARKIFQVRKNFKIVKQAILQQQPDVVVLVDYPGFNLKMSAWLKKQQFKVVYYIAPKVWAWKEKRVEILRKYVDKLIVIFPFEQEYFQRHHIQAEYFGNPLVEIVPHSSVSFPTNKLAILPGSRKQEIRKMLPVMLESVESQQSGNVVVSGMSQFGKDFYHSIIQGRAELVMDDMYRVLDGAQLAIVTSGTASLETALVKIPQVVCYSMHPFTYLLAKRWVKVKYISLVNLILDESAVPELIQSDLNKENLKNTVQDVLSRTKLMEDAYLRLGKLLGNSTVTIPIANSIFQFAHKGD